MSMVVEGGQRDRFLAESFVRHVLAGLDAKGWFDVDRQHPAVKVITTHLPSSEELNVDTNTYVVVMVDQATASDAETGSNLSEDRWYGWVDVFARSDGLGSHLAGDARDLLRGKLYSIGYDTPGFTVTDAPNDPPTDLFWVDIERVRRDRDENQPRGMFRYQVGCELVEYRP